MTGLRWLWSELTRPRGPVQHRFYRNRRRSRAGVALLITITSLLFMSVIVTEIAFEATVRMELGAHQRDEAKAEALAESGIGIYRLILIASKAIGKNPMINQVELALGMNLADALWEMIPTINTAMMRMIFVTGGDESQLKDVQANGGLTADQQAQSRKSTAMTHNFLDFDGDFTASVTDEDHKINISNFKATSRADLPNDPAAVMLYGLMTGTRICPDPYATDEQQALSQAERDDLDKFFLDRNIDRWELIGNLIDWTDADNTRVFDGGAEDSVYNSLDHDPYLPKNAGFDTLDEVRMVDLWNKDDVWDKFGPAITVYGTGKVNINTAGCDVQWALLKSYVIPQPNDDQTGRLMEAIQQQKALVPFADGRSFAAFIKNQGVDVDPKLASAVTTDSRVFHITSTGQVGNSSVTIETIIDFSGSGASSQVGKVVFWRVE